MFCTQCGSELPEGVTHCLVCGAPARFVPDRPAAPASQPPAAAPSSPGSGEQDSAPGPAYAPASSGPAYQAASQPGPAYQSAPQPGPGGPGLPPPAGPAQPGGRSYPAYQQYVQHGDGSDSPETVGMGEWLLANLLMLVPVVNIILLFIWSFGSGYKPSKKNWARAQLIMMAVSAVIFIFLGTAVFGWMWSEMY